MWDNGKFYIKSSIIYKRKLIKLNPNAISQSSMEGTTLVASDKSHFNNSLTHTTSNQAETPVRLGELARSFLCTDTSLEANFRKGGKNNNKEFLAPNPHIKTPVCPNSSDNLVPYCH